MTWGALLVVVAALLSPGASFAALQKYELATRVLVQNPLASPNPDSVPNLPEEHDVALVDGSGPAPVLLKLVDATDSTVTIVVPESGAQIFFSSNQRTGPHTGIILGGGTPPPFTGTGSAAAGGTVAWGVVTGWSITGTEWCNSSPPVLCSFAEATDEETIDPFLHSPFYDLGTWWFHDTGFTSAPYALNFEDNSFGNVMVAYRGPRVFDGTIPALPWVGLALAFGSLGVAAARSRRPPGERPDPPN